MPAHTPHHRLDGPRAAPSRSQGAARAAALLTLAAVALAVLWPSGQHVAGTKDAIGPWFLELEGKDLVLNVVMLLPLTFCAHLGWPRVPWWAWALAGCALSALAELAQWLLPALDRRPLLANVLENSAGACAGAILAALVLAIQQGSARRPRQHAPVVGP